MPIYVFRCKCGHQVDEYFHHANSPSTIECEACGGTAEKILASASVVVKGQQADLYRLQKVLAEDRKKIAKGDEDFISNLTGSSQNIPTNSNVKYLNDIPANKKKIKRREAS